MKRNIKINEAFLTRSLISNPDQKSIGAEKYSSSNVQDIKHKREWVRGDNGFMIRVKKADEDDTSQA